MTADGPEKTRLFRATSTSDIICASIVADLLPRGRNILALSTDKSNAEPSEYRECYQSLARLHPWASVVDLSGIPMVSQFQKKLTLWNRYRGIGLAIASLRELRSRLAGALSIHAPLHELRTLLDREIDELYLTVPHHPDVLALCQVLKGTRKIYYPHTLDSISLGELAFFHRVRESVHSSVVGHFQRHQASALGRRRRTSLCESRSTQPTAFDSPFPGRTNSTFSSIRSTRRR